MDSSDGGAIVLGWLTRLAVFLGVFGVLVFDGLSLTVTRLTLEDDAEAAAIAGVHSFQETRNPERAYEAALFAVRASNPEDTVAPGSFNVQPDGRVCLTLQREARTIVAHHIPVVKEHLTLRADADAAP